jgi:hypothetical protein
MNEIIKQSSEFLTGPITQERYFTARFGGKLSKLYGSRGQILTGIYEYLRWVDDNADENPYFANPPKALEFLGRQRVLVTYGTEAFGNITPQERRFLDLPWNNIREELQHPIREAITNLLDGIELDILHGGSLARNFKEIRKYNINNFGNSIDIIGLSLNSRNPGRRPKFDEFLNQWSMLGTLNDFAEDLENHQLKVGFSPEEAEEINLGYTASYRRLKALYIYTKERFNSEKLKSLAQTALNVKEFLGLDIPWWQKLLSIVYMFRAVTKASIIIRYPQETFIANLKREGIRDRLKLLISQNRPRIDEEN